MCTVSVIAWRDGIRLACNRDELLSRPPALPPVLRSFGAHRAILPIDPATGGTWIAASDAGLVMALLNVNPTPRRVSDQSPRLSRGIIIPGILHCDRIRDAVERAHTLDPDDFPPFRLLILDQHRWTEVFSIGRDLRCTSHRFDGAPLLFTSCGLGDDLVESPRRLLFDHMIRGAGPCPRRQDAFHAHRWPDRPQISVNMSRADARTVSRTVVELADGAIHLRYASDEEPFVSSTLELTTLQHV
jgi:hypothetical protein